MRFVDFAQGHLDAHLILDHSVFVRASIDGVVKVAAIAAILTGLMILLFLGSWRSTIIVVVSIPLSILVSIMVLHALGQTLNVMSLGGMALAVGILVDDATVAIENIHRNIGQRKPFIKAIVDGAQEIAVPAFVSTLCICIVFVPIGFLTGAARSLFVPLALAVVFAMMMSYFLSRTLVPTLVRYLLRKEAEEHHDPGRFFGAFNRAFERLRDGYGRVLAWTLAHRAPVIVAFLLFVAGSLSLVTLIGRDFFPTVDAGLIKLHVRGAPGTRLEESEKRIAAIQDTIRTVIPKDETHLHYGDGATKATVKLPPGKHQLTMQFADGAHRSYGPAWAATITVEVEGGAGAPAGAAAAPGAGTAPTGAAAAPGAGAAPADGAAVPNGGGGGSVDKGD